MAYAKGNTEATSDVTYGLSQLELHWRAEDGEIEQLSLELWDSWPVDDALDALKEDHPDHKGMFGDTSRWIGEVDARLTEVFIRMTEQIDHLNRPACRLEAATGSVGSC
jgi:hypothetical protein